MAKSDSFFLRQTLNCENVAVPGQFKQVEMDLGAYVSALGKSVLRIHNIAVSFTDLSGRSPDIKTGGEKAVAAQFQLTTQTQGNLVIASNKSVVASGLLNAYRTNSGSAGVADSTSESMDNLPQLWTNGYLVATESMYLGGAASAEWNEDVYVSVTCECTVETMSQASAMALSLSQQ